MSLNLDRLDEPLRREWQKLSKHLHESSQRHLQEQEFLVAGFLDDIIRVQARAKEAASNHRDAGPQPSQYHSMNSDAQQQGSGVSKETSLRSTKSGRQTSKQLSISGLDEAEQRWLKGIERGNSRKPTLHISDEDRAFDLDDRMTDRELICMPCQEFAAWWESIKEPTRSGRLNSIVTSGRFQALCVLVIAINSIYIFVLTNQGMGDWKEQWRSGRSPELDGDVDFLEIALLLFFWVELFLKLSVHRIYFFVAGEAHWNVFDMLLVMMSTLDVALKFAKVNSLANVGFVRLSRLFRLGKALRMLRVFQGIKPLRLMLDCLVDSMSSLLWAFVFLVFMFSLFAILIVQTLTNVLKEMAPGQLAEDEVDEIVRDFGSVQQCILSLFKMVSGGEAWGHYFNIFSKVSTAMNVWLVGFVVFFIIVIANIFTAIFVHKMSDLASSDFEDEGSLNRKKRSKDLKAFKELCSEFDSDGSGALEVQELQQHILDPRFKAFFQERGLDVRDSEGLLDMLTDIGAEGEVAFADLYTALTQLKGPARSADLHLLSFQVRAAKAEQNKFQRFCLLRLQGLAERLNFAEALVEKSPEAVRSVQQDIAALTTVLMGPEAAPQPPSKAEGS